MFRLIENPDRFGVFSWIVEKGSAQFRILVLRFRSIFRFVVRVLGVKASDVRIIFATLDGGYNPL